MGESRGGPMCWGDHYRSPPRLALSRQVLGSAERAHHGVSDQVLLFLLFCFGFSYYSFFLY